MRLLVTNGRLQHRAGSELYARDVAGWMRDRGHHVTLYSPCLGAFAEELRRAGFPVIADPRDLPDPPDLIHGQHHLATFSALLAWPGVPAVYVCHGAVPWEEEPPRSPRIRRYVAVDAPCRERLLAAGVPAADVETIYNFADPARFPPRPPLPSRPRRALVLSNQVAIESPQYAALRRGCELEGVELDVAGIASERVTAEPGGELAGADLVFAKGRSAIEAMVVGCAVVTADAAGLGPLVSPANLDALRPLNFGFRTLTEPLTAELVAQRIAGYDAAAAARVSDRMRSEAGMDDALERLAAVYERALERDAAQGPGPAAQEAAANAAYLRWLEPFLTERLELLAWRKGMTRWVEERQGDWARAVAERDRALAERCPADAEIERLRGELRRLDRDLAKVTGTTTWRLYEKLLAVPGVARLYSAVRSAVRALVSRRRAD